MTTKLKVTLGDGNAFAIMGACQKVMRQANMSAEEIKAFIDDCTSGDYNHLLRTVMERFEVSLESEEYNEEYNEEEEN